MEWVRVTVAAIRSGHTQNQLYRIAALGRVRTRSDTHGRIEFAVEDLDKLSAASASKEKPRLTAGLR